MGADGHITIWDAEKVRAAFSDADTLIECLPTSYRHELAGRAYLHCYHGDNLGVHWFDKSDWYLLEGVTEERLTEFVTWLEENADAEWEVWT